MVVCPYQSTGLGFLPWMDKIFFGIEGGLGSVDTIRTDLSYSLLKLLAYIGKNMSCSVGRWDLKSSHFTNSP